MKERGTGKKKEKKGYNGAMLRGAKTPDYGKGYWLKRSRDSGGHVSSRENSRGQGAGGLSNLEAGTCYGAQGSGGHGRRRRRQGTGYKCARCRNAALLYNRHSF